MRKRMLESSLYMFLRPIRQTEKAVILGDPGSGKSSFVKYLAANIASAELGEQSLLIDDLAGLLPVLIELRALTTRLRDMPAPPNAGARRRALARVIVEQAVDHAMSLDCAGFEDAMRRAFDQKKVFLIFDGLDEVPADERVVVREAVGAALDLL